MKKPFSDYGKTSEVEGEGGQSFELEISNTEGSPKREARVADLARQPTKGI